MKQNKIIVAVHPDAQERRKIIQATIIRLGLAITPVDRISDSGNWSVNGLIKVYTEYYITRTAHYPTAVRKLVSSMILSAANRTVAYYKSQSQENPVI